MKKIFRPVLFFGLVISIMGCKEQETNISDDEKSDIIESAKLTVQKVFEYSNNFKFIEGLDFYSEDVHNYYTNNGAILSLDELKESYSQIGSSIEILENSIDSWNSTVLSRNIVVFTLPVRLRIKLKGLPEYTGQLVWSGIVQKRNGNWLIIQSHESWLNCAEVTNALSQSAN